MEVRMSKFVVVAGNIGVGKSSLVNLLSEYLGWKPFFEPVVENPYLADFYTDMERWGFHSQVFFLSHRVNIHQSIMAYNGSVIMDRSIYEDAEIFAKNLFLTAQFEERDYQTYRVLYTAFMKVIQPPDLIIYLRASVNTLQERIAQRARSYEREISDDYLAQLNELYEHWVRQIDFCPVLTIPADDLDFVARPQHLSLIAEKILQRLSGVEEVVFDNQEIH